LIVILGGGELAESIVRDLSKKGERPLWLVPEGTQVHKPRGAKPRLRSVPPSKLVSSVPEEAGAAYVLGGDFQCERLATRLRRARPDILILAEASSLESANRLRRAAIDFVMETRSFLATTMVEEITELESRRAARRLVASIQACREKGLAIVLHDNPDPDTLASALALKRICKESRVPCTLYHGGDIGHPSNRAMVSLIGVELVKLPGPEQAAIAMKRHSKVALIESTRPGQNNVLPEKAKVDIIIDHHPLPESLVPDAEFVDRRPSVGAAATILTGYLRNLWIRPDPVLASALLYGIKVDTNIFTRNVDAQDLSAAVFLSEHADMQLMYSFEHPRMSAAAADVIGRAVRDRESVGGHVLSFVGELEDRDSLAQAAELLLRLEGVKAAVVYGVLGEDLCISARTMEPSIELGRILRKAFGSCGSAGGHATMAGAKVPLASLAQGRGRERSESAADAARRAYLEAAEIRTGG
jgi:nanoRNase/pAp phosphatase (c-di-AMP/oligoRNAs hydrolase)